MSALRILGRITSINVRKVLWAADEMGITYDREDWGTPVRDPKVPEFLALNPNGQVPVIVDEGFVLWESNAIVTYLARKHHSELLPRNVQRQGLCEQWLYWQLGELNPQWGYAVYALLRKHPAYTDEVRIADSVNRWTGKMEVLEGQLERTRAYVCGDTFTVADIAIALSVHRWFMTPMQHRAFPEIARYYERMKDRKAGKRWLTRDTP